MPRPNRTERRLHWRIELFKLSWATNTGALALLVTLGLREPPVERWIMSAMTAIIISLTVYMVGMGIVVYLATRGLPDE